jgi:PKD repeat protein
VDWGQNEPYNPDGRPLGGIDVDDPPLEGGALRSQDLRSSADPLKYSGTVLRVHPDTGAAWPGNPLQGGSVDDDRILAYGLRNPFRFAVHPTRNDVWIADVGWDQWEEINRIPYPFASVLNFGWPAYEGVGRQWSYDNADLPLLESLYSQGGHTAPYYTYSHVGSSSVTGVVFYTGGDYPSQYVNALFFGDYARQWIKVMFPGANGLPDTGNIVTFVSSGAAVVDLQRGPGGDIYYVEINDGQVRRFDYLSGNQAPVAVCSANPTTGNAPLTVSFTGSNSYDPDPGDLLTYSWDLNADGTFGDSSAANPQYTYTQPGSYLVRLRVTDTGGASSTASLTISVNNLPPQPVILTPTEGTLWRVGDVISFSGSANDPETGTMPASALSWQVVLFHCFASDPTDCHEHTMLTLNGAASGQFTAIDHEYPAYLEIRLTATEPGPGGLSTTAVLPLLPETATYQFATNPPGLTLSVQSATGPTPFDQEFIVNGSVTVSAPSPQSLNGQSYTFVSWSDGGAQSHNFTATASGATLVANYQATNLPPVINRIGPKNVKEGALLAFQVSASDPNGTIPVLTAANLPSGATFTDNRNGTGNFSWVPPIGSSAGSPYNVTFTASDGALTASEVAQIRVRSAKSR